MSEHELDRSVGDAIRRFPDRADLVRDQAVRDAAFRDMCDELFAAEAALARTGSLPQAIQAERRAECEMWIRRLTEEIGAALAGAEAAIDRRDETRRSF
jgi:hypothetical protein